MGIGWVGERARPSAVPASGVCTEGPQRAGRTPRPPTTAPAAQSGTQRRQLPPGPTSSLGGQSPSEPRVAVGCCTWPRGCQGPGRSSLSGQLLAGCAPHRGAAASSAPRHAGQGPAAADGGRGPTARPVPPLCAPRAAEGPAPASHRVQKRDAQPPRRSCHFTAHKRQTLPRHRRPRLPATSHRSAPYCSFYCN